MSGSQSNPSAPLGTVDNTSGSGAAVAPAQSGATSGGSTTPVTPAKPPVTPTAPQTTPKVTPQQTIQPKGGTATNPNPQATNPQPVTWTRYFVFVTKNSDLTGSVPVMGLSTSDRYGNLPGAISGLEMIEVSQSKATDAGWAAYMDKSVSTPLYLVDGILDVGEPIVIAMPPVDTVRSAMSSLMAVYNANGWPTFGTPPADIEAYGKALRALLVKGNITSDEIPAAPADLAQYS